MNNTSRKRVLHDNRTRLSERRLARFEVLGRVEDRALIRSLAQRLTEDTPEAAALRAMISGALTTKPSRGQGAKGGILAALRRSPLVGSDIDLERLRCEGRDIVL